MANAQLSVTVLDALVPVLVDLANYELDQSQPANAPHNVTPAQAKAYFEADIRADLKFRVRKMRREQYQALATVQFEADANAAADAFDSGAFA